MYHGGDNEKSTPIPIGGGRGSPSAKSSPPTFSSSPNTYNSSSKNQPSIPSTLVFTRTSSTISPASPISASYSSSSLTPSVIGGQHHFPSSNLTSSTSERKTTFHFGRKKSVLKATPIISPLLLPNDQVNSTSNSFNVGGSSALTSNSSTSGAMTSQGSSGNLESAGQSLLENSTMASFASWEELNGSMLSSFDSFSSVSSNSGSFDSSYEDNSDISKRSSVGKSRKFTTFISKIFGKNQEMQGGSPKSNSRSKSKFLNSLSETDDFFRDSAIGLDTSPSSSSGSLKSHHAASNSLDNQERSFTDLDTKQKSMFNGWFQEKASILEDLFEKEGCVYFYKNQIKPGQNFKKRSSTTLNLSSNSSSSNEGYDDDSNDSSREEDVFVERFLSCKNSAITIFEKGTKDSPVKYSFSWNQNVTFSLIPTEKSFDTVVAKSVKKATRYNKSQYFLFEIRVEQSDNFYVMDPLILVGLVRTREERDDWAELFEIYSIYSSLNVLTEDEFTLSSTLTREETLREYFIQEYELFDEYQNEVREQGENQRAFYGGETMMDPRLSTIENPFEETNAFQREMEKSYTYLIQSFDPYLAINQLQ